MFPGTSTADSVPMKMMRPQTLTPDGADLVRRATPGHVELVRRVVFAPLDDAEARRLGETARRVSAAIGSDGAWLPAG